jgi:hypothetical protein
MRAGKKHPDKLSAVNNMYWPRLSLKGVRWASSEVVLESRS